MTIDIGAAATDRSGSPAPSGYTWFDTSNVANGSGSITSVEIWAAADLSNCEVATFYVVSGVYYSTRDSETIGSVTAGSKQTFSGLNMDVVMGDSIGIHYSAGTLENDTGTIYARYTSGDYIPCTNQPFNTSGRLLSLYGEGGTEATEKSSSDGGSGVEDTPAQSAVLAGGESGSGVDAVESLQTPQVKTSSDAGSGVEGTPSQSAILAGGESGSGLEALIARLLSGNESGGAVEAADVDAEGLLKDLFASEPGEGCDRLVAKIEMPIKGGGMKLWT